MVGIHTVDFQRSRGPTSLLQAASVQGGLVRLACEHRRPSVTLPDGQMVLCRMDVELVLGSKSVKVEKNVCVCVYIYISI